MYHGTKDGTVVHVTCPHLTALHGLSRYFHGDQSLLKLQEDWIMANAFANKTETAAV